MSLHYFELPKLPKLTTAKNGKELWLSLFNAKTEEDLTSIKALGVPAMEKAIGAYHEITAESMFRESERLRIRASHDEASALGNAERRGEARAEKRNAKEHKRLQSIIAKKDAENEALRMQLAELQAKHEVNETN